MHAIKAIYDGTNFTPIQPIPVKEKYEVIITFIEPVKDTKEDTDNIKEQPEKLPRLTGRGLWKGKVWMSDDFNEPIEEMKEYME